MTRASSSQSGTDALVDEVVRGRLVRCYADRPSSVVEVLERSLPASAHDVLLVDPALGTSTTYDGFARLVEGAAAVLTARGLAPGARVAGHNPPT